MLTVEFGSPAKRFLKKCDKTLAQRLIERIERLAVEPFPSDVKRVQGKKEKVFRVRVGNYRIQYVVFSDRNMLFVTDIDTRERAYAQGLFRKEYK